MTRGFVSIKSNESSELRFTKTWNHFKRNQIVLKWNEISNYKLMFNEMKYLIEWKIQTWNVKMWNLIDLIWFRYIHIDISEFLIDFSLESLESI